MATFMVGAGAAKIEYPNDFFPYSGFRGRYITGVHDDIYARAIALTAGEETLLILSVELGDITDEWVPEISRTLDVPEKNIFLTATHNHEAPYANSGWGERVEDEEKTAPFCEKCLEAVYAAAKWALDSRRNATVGFGTGFCGVNVSRVFRYTGNQSHITSPYISVANEHEFSDHSVYVMRFTDEEGQIIALLVNYPVHSSIQFRQSWDKAHGNLISGDLAGAAMRYVEEHVPGAVALMTLGAAGDQIPRAVMIHPVIDGRGNMSEADYGDEAGYALSDAMGRELGEEVVYTAERARDVKDAGLAAWEDLYTIELKHPWEGGPPFALPVGYEYEPCGTMDMRLQLFRIGDVGFFCIPSELVASVGEDIKKILRETGFADAVIVTQCNGAWQYISDTSGYERKTFEAIESHFMPSVGERLCRAAQELSRQALTK